MDIRHGDGFHDVVTQLRVWRSDPIAVVTAKVQDKVGIPPDQQRLSINGVELEDGRALWDYKIRWDDELHVAQVGGALGSGAASSGL